jgi:hypothetical protein
MLEQDNLRALGATSEVEWMDSCAAPENPLINRIADSRTAMQSIVLGFRAPAQSEEARRSFLRWGRAK